LLRKSKNAITPGIKVENSFRQRSYYVNVRYYLEETNPDKDETLPDDEVVDCIDV
jgi:hypothetical protein